MEEVKTESIKVKIESINNNIEKISINEVEGDPISLIKNLIRELINRNNDLSKALEEISELKEKEEMRNEIEITTLGDLMKGNKVYLRTDGSKREEKIK